MSDFVVTMGEIVSIDHNSVDVMGDYLDVMNRFDSVMSDANCVMKRNGDFAHNAFITTHTFIDFDRSVDEGMGEKQVVAYNDGEVSGKKVRHIYRLVSV